MQSASGAKYHLHEKNIVGPTGEIGKGEAFY